MDIQAVNVALNRAIIGLQGAEIEAMAEAMATGSTSYEVPPPTGVAFGRTGAYKVPSPPPLRPKKARKRKQSVKLAKTKRKQLITQIYKVLPKFNKSIVRDDDGVFTKTTLKAGGRHMITWSPTLADAMGRSSWDSTFLDELSDFELRLLADELDIGTSKVKDPISGLKWKMTNKGEKLMTRVAGEKLFKVMKYLRDTNKGAIVNDVFIDVTTADLIVKLAEKYHTQTRKKFLDMPVDEMGMWAWGFFSSRGEVSFGQKVA